MNPQIRTALLVLLGGVLVVFVLPFLLIGGAIGYEAGGEYLRRTPFESAAWQDSVRVFSQEQVRIRMVDDLLERTELTGMPRAEVVGMLGEPEETRYFRDWDMVYWLGSERSLMGLDSEWLVLRLDENRRVAEHRIVTD